MDKQFTDKALLVTNDEQGAFRELYDRYWEPFTKAQELIKMAFLKYAV